MPKTKKTEKKVKKAVKPRKRTKKVEKPKPAPKLEKYYQAEGKRKTAVARIRLFTSKVKSQKEELGRSLEQVFLVNEKALEQYFPTPELRQIAQSSLEKMKCLDKFKVSIRVRGGGLKAQAEAIRHGIARALVLFNPDFRKRLKTAGFLTRDPRMRERKKFGLKRARRAPQWQKR
jgi:small subunit ribosomal protein S9